MVVNVYFNNFNNPPEQTLYENLVIESIRQYGVNAYYIPRDVVNTDSILREGEYHVYNRYYLIEMYVKNVDGYSGEGEFLSKWGHEIRDQITFSVARRVFELEIGQNEVAKNPAKTPREGDIIWIPMFRIAYQIDYSTPRAVMWPLGTLPVFDLVCQTYEYSNDIFETGIEELDNKYNTLKTIDKPSDFDIETVDIQAQNTRFQTFANNIVDFSEDNPFGEP